ncbi:unnamed protein product [Ceratitis capitata]|uniref:(Mediterranean fruit fly) hypothetical protein n=1 Tax=Ceratitis capitata TaxID=7213 RepID=A0A811UIT4_CERCA|nr:unnamed protein product [Ceratitis capitata]
MHHRALFGADAHVRLLEYFKIDMHGFCNTLGERVYNFDFNFNTVVESCAPRIELAVRSLLFDCETTNAYTMLSEAEGN